MNTVLGSFAGSLAGGAAGGAIIAIANVPDFAGAASAFSAAGGFLIYLVGIAVFAFFGLVGGLMFGLLPTVVLGSVLSPFRNIGPFRHFAAWGLAGALAGIAIYLWSPFGSPSLPHNRIAWACAWAAGGAVSMIVFKAVGAGTELVRNVAR